MPSAVPGLSCHQFTTALVRTITSAISTRPPPQQRLTPLIKRE